MGVRAGAVLAKIKELDFVNKIYGIAVSNKQDINKFGDFNVYNIEELIEFGKNLILISVKKDTIAYQEIECKLKKLGFTNYIDTEFIKYF